MKRAALLAVAVALLAAPGSSAQVERHALSLRPFLSGLASPTYVTAPRSEPGRLYVVEQAGRILVANGRTIRKTPFLDIRSLVRSGGEQGLLSVAFHPAYTRNHRFYVDYTDRNGDTRVVEYRSSGGKALPRSARQLLFVKQPYPNHNGGQLQFGPDGLLYVGMGDGGSGGDPGNRAQNLGTKLGKLLRIDPLKRRATWQIAGYGLRNPWRFSFDRSTGDLYIGDVGQGAFEEIDFTPRSSPGLENYGWRVFEGRARYQAGQQPNPAGTLVGPVAVFSHEGGNCSVTGGYVYRGAAVPAAAGRYLYGDFCSGRIWSLRMNGSSAEVREEQLHVDQISSWGEDARGELYAVSLAGSVLKLAG